MTFRWHPPSGSWWIPSRSYFKVQVSLTKPDGTTPLTLEDGIAPNMGLCGCLFSKLQYKINEKTVSEISEHVPQIDALKTRLRYPGNWLETTGDNLNLWNSNFNIRQNKMIVGGGVYDNIRYKYAQVPAINWRNLINAQDDDEIGYNHTNFNTAGECCLVFQDTDGNADPVYFRLGGDPNAALDPALQLANVAVGSYMSLFLGDEAGIQEFILRIIRIDTAVPGEGNNNSNRIIFERPTTNRANSNLVDLNGVGNANNYAFSARIVDIDQERNIKQWTMIWQPPLSIFDINHAIPGSSKHELAFNPFNNGIYQKNAIESIISDKDHTTDGILGDFRFKVDDMIFYAARCDGPIMKKDEFFLDLTECRLQTETITSQARSQYSLDISPSTHALTVAFQDQSAESNSLYSQTKFKIRNQEELNLTNFYVRYGGIQKPQPDYRPVLNDASQIDYFVEAYGRSILYNGSYYDASAETLKVYRDRGYYMHWPWPKTGTDRETRVYVSTEFSNLSSTPKLLLFNHFKKVCILKYEQGQLQEILINEV